MEQDFQQLVAAYRENLNYDAKDEDLVVAINMAIADSKNLKDLMDNVGKHNKMVWEKGTSEDLSLIHPKRAKVVNNRIFADVETSIPILTAEPPEASVINVSDPAVKDKLQRGLKIAYEVTYKLQQILQRMVRHWYLNRIGIVKYRWDEEDGFITENVLPKKMGFDKTSDCLDNAEFCWETMEDTVDSLLVKYPSKKDAILQKAGGNNKDSRTKLRYMEFWGGNGEWYVCKLDEIILKKKLNPNFDYDNEENNIFDRPKFPYLIMNVFTTGDETGIYDDISLIEQATPLQLASNQLERQILDLNEGQKRVWVGSAAAISEKQFQQLIQKTGDFGVYMDRNAPIGSLQQVQSGKPDASLYNNLTHLLTEIDNILGTHSTTRGERSEKETLGGRQLLKASDLGRQDLIVRNIEQVIEEWYIAYLHMIKVYADEAEILDDGEQKPVEILPEEIPSNTVIMVKKGSTLPKDDVSQFEQAFQLAQANLIDPSTLFEEMGYPDPELRFNKLLKWLQLTGKIQLPQDQEQPGQDGQGQQHDPALALKQQQLQRLNGMIKVVGKMPKGKDKTNLLKQAREILAIINQ